jgi:hypothetical protein
MRPLGLVGWVAARDDSRGTRGHTRVQPRPPTLMGAGGRAVLRPEVDCGLVLLAVMAPVAKAMGALTMKPSHSAARSLHRPQRLAQVACEVVQALAPPRQQQAPA